MGKGFLPMLGALRFGGKRGKTAADEAFASRFARAMAAERAASAETGVTRDRKTKNRRFAFSSVSAGYGLSLLCMALTVALFATQFSFPDKNELAEAIRRGTRVVVDVRDGHVYGRLRPPASRLGAGGLSVTAGGEGKSPLPPREKGGEASVTIPVPGATDHGGNTSVPSEGHAKPSGHDAKDGHGAPAEKAVPEAHGASKEEHTATSAGPAADAPPSAKSEAAHASAEAAKSDSAAAVKPPPASEPAVSKSESSASVSPAAPPPSDGAPLIAVVIKGVGMSASGTEAALSLPSEFTLGFSPYSPSLKEAMQAAVQDGHEALLNVPMEAKDFNVRDAGPFSLSASLSQEDNLGRMEVALAQDVPVAGVYTDQDERFTSQPAAVATFIGELRRRGLALVYGAGYAQFSFFQEAAKAGYKNAAGADVQLDNVNEPEAVDKLLEEAVKAAERRGYAVVMASPYPSTVKQLRKWAERLKESKQGGKPRAHIVPVSALRGVLAAAPEASAAALVSPSESAK